MDVPSATLRANGLEFPAFEAGEGPIVLCLHGFPDHARSFRHQLPALAGAGYRAIAPTMRGYHPRCQPKDGDYRITRLAEDVVGWIDDLGAERVHLVGHDWGAVTAYVAGALAPERFHSITTLAVPQIGRFLREAVFRVPRQALNSWYILFFQLPGLPERKVAADDFAFLDAIWRAWSPGWDYPVDEMRSLKETFALPGVLGATLAYYRAIPRAVLDRAAFALTVRPIPVPTLAMTGARDGCMDTRLHDRLMREGDFPRGFEVARFPDLGHFLHQEDPAAVNARLLAWLARHSPRRPA